jgi:hypothetical protein
MPLPSPGMRRVRLKMFRFFDQFGELPRVSISFDPQASRNRERVRNSGIGGRPAAPEGLGTEFVKRPSVETHKRFRRRADSAEFFELFKVSRADHDLFLPQRRVVWQGHLLTCLR